MNFVKVLALRGPNLWAASPLIEAWLDPVDFESMRSADLPRITNRLLGWLPGLVTTSCIADSAPAANRLACTGSLSLMLQQVARELERLASGNPDAVAEFPVVDETKVILPFRNEALMRACLAAAAEIVAAARDERELPLADMMGRLSATASETALSPTAAAIADAAARRDIPVRLIEGGKLIQLGHGSRQRRVQGLRTDRTSAIAESVVRDPHLVESLLRSSGVPVVDPDDLPVSPTHRLLIVGRRVVAAIALGEIPVDVTDDLHPEVAARAGEAASAVQLDVAAIDLRADSLTQPLERQNGGVVAIEADPAVEPFIAAGCGAAVGEALVGSLIPNGQTGRIPVVGVTGVNGKTTTTRLIAHVFARKGDRVGMATTDGIYVGSRRIDDGDCSGPQSARNILLNPAVDAAVLETARGGILREGLGFDHCDIAVVTNIGEGDHLGLGGIETPEQLARVKRTVVRGVSRHGTAVLNAEDPLVAAMAEHCIGSVAFFALRDDHPVLLRRRTEGCRVAFVRDNTIMLAEGDSEFALMSLDLVPLTYRGRIGFQVANVLAATLATWAAGIPAEIIRAALESFSPSVDKIPGRFNLMEIRGATVVFDYGHNPSSLLAIIETLEQFPNERRLAIYTAAGDRRDVDMIRQGQLLGDAFDQVTLFEGQYVRGREPGEIMKLFRDGLAQGRRVNVVHQAESWKEAVDTTLRSLRAGDLLLIQADEVHETVDYVQRHLKESGLGREVETLQQIDVSVEVSALVSIR